MARGLGAPQLRPGTAVASMSTITLPYFQKLTKREEKRKAGEADMHHRFHAAVANVDHPAPEAQRGVADELLAELSGQSGKGAGIGGRVKTIEQFVERKGAALVTLPSPASREAESVGRFLVRSLVLQSVLKHLEAQEKAGKLSASDETVERVCAAWIEGSPMDRIHAHFDAFTGQVTEGLADYESLRGQRKEDGTWPDVEDMPQAVVDSTGPRLTDEQVDLVFDSVFTPVSPGLVEALKRMRGVTKRQWRALQRATRVHFRDGVEFPLKYRCCVAWADKEGQLGVGETPTVTQQQLLHACARDFYEEFGNAVGELSEEFQRKEDKYWTNRVARRQFWSIAFAYLFVIGAADFAVQSF